MVIAMDTDEASTINDPEDAAWVAEQRQIVIEYLAKEGCEHNGVSVEPRWFVSPYVALWAVRSKSHSDGVGWWAISGDLPTDYLTASNDLRTSGDVLIAFAQEWRVAAERMKRGEHPDDVVIGDPARAKELAPLLERRANLLQKFGKQLNDSESEGGARPCVHDRGTQT